MSQPTGGGLTRLCVWVLGWVWWLVVPVRRQEAVDALCTALPGEWAPGQRLRHAVGSVAWGYIELLLDWRPTWLGLEEARGGAVVVTGHLGPWDPCLVQAARIVPITVFLKVPSHGPSAGFIAWLRRRDGSVDLEPLPVSDAMSAARAALDRGRVVVFVVDQRHGGGVPVRFLGRPATASPGLGALLHTHPVPVFRTHQWRDPSGRVWCQAERLDWRLPADRTQCAVIAAQLAQDAVEEGVYKHPGDWWWLHRRWR